jgi:DNA-binding NarL/FixJ family response regulator
MTIERSDQRREERSSETAGSNGTPLRVFLVDDHAVVREGLRALIDAQPDMQVVGQAGDGKSALQNLPGCQPDIAVLDISMPGLSGPQVAEQVKQSCPRTKVLALSVHEDKSYLRQMLEAGASGYVLKRAAADELIRAVRTVAAGGVYLDPQMAGKVVGGFVGKSAPQLLRGEIEGAALSERESEVIRLLAQGYTNKEIAVQLSISVKTVETYKARSMEKLSLSSRAEIVRYALDQGWMTTG